MKHKDEKRVYCQYPTHVPAVLPSIQLFFINLWFRRLPVTLCHRSFFYQSSLPSPHSGQVKSCCLVTKSCPTLCNPMDYSPPGSFCPWDFLGKNTAVGCFFFFSPGDLPNPGIETCISCSDRWVLHHWAHQGSTSEKYQNLIAPKNGLEPVTDKKLLDNYPSFFSSWLG